jgi:hypothetical protein
MYRDERGPSARRQPPPRERDQRTRDPRARDSRTARARERPISDWEDPDSGQSSRDDRSGRDDRYSSDDRSGRAGRGGRPGEPGGARPRWGALPGLLGVCVVVGGAAFGALASAVTNTQPGLLLSICLIAGTVVAVLAVRPKSVYAIIPVPALAYLVASVMTGLAVNQNGTTLTALAVGATQWIASGFMAMIIATVIAIIVTIVRWPRKKGGGPRRPQPPPSRGSRPPRPADDRSRRSPDDRPRRNPDDRPRRSVDDRPRRAPDRRADSVATTAMPEWRPREGRNG